MNEIQTHTPGKRNAYATKNARGTASLLQSYQMRKSQISFLSWSRQSVDSSITCILQIFSSTKCLLHWMPCGYEMHLAAGKNSINPAKLPNVPLNVPLTLQLLLRTGWHAFVNLTGGLGHLSRQWFLSGNVISIAYQEFCRCMIYPPCH